MQGALQLGKLKHAAKQILKCLVGFHISDITALILGQYLTHYHYQGS